ncbi:toll-like receptor 4 [Mytilus trossulus]|uniref:toll-like receptor 4 n=1 Tax=Mytilus trossulus TaxID=6551 RepID=UPI0030074314
MFRIIIHFVWFIVIYCGELSCLLNCDIKYAIRERQRFKIADCTNRGLNFIPQHLPEDIKVLDMSSNKLTLIENNSFNKYKYLEEFYCRNNQLNDLSNESFKGLHKLSILDMSHNMLNLSKVYSSELFHPIQNLSKLDIRSNMAQPINYHKEFNYPDHALGALTELTFLGIDMMPVPIYGSGFSLMTKLQELHFQSCYLVSLTNKTFQRFSSTLKVLSLRNCRLKLVKTEDDALSPFPHLRVLDFYRTFMHLTRALLLLHPYRYRNMTTINFGHVSDLSIDSDELPYALTITPDLVRNLKTICIENLDLSENGIVDYTRGALFSFDQPECLQKMSFKGNRFLLFNWKNQKEVNSFFFKALQLKTLDYSYNVVNFIIPKNALPSNLKVKSAAGSYVILPQSLEKLDLSNTVVNPYASPLFIVPKINNLTYLDISYSDSTADVTFLKLRLKTFISAGTRYEYALHQLNRFQNNNLTTVIFKGASLNDGIRHEGNRLFKDLRSVELLDISENYIWYFPDELLNALSNLSSLYISKNLLASIPVQLNSHTNIKILDFKHNLLTSVSSTITNWADKMQQLHGMTLKLEGNAFECNCDSVDFIRWIHTTKVDLDSRSYKCKLSNGTVIDTLIAYNNLHDLFVDCKYTVWLTLASALLSTSFTISLLLLVYNKRWRIIFSIYRIIRRKVERKVRKSYLYDVYMSYEGEVVIWIKDVLVPKLETEWGLTLCIKDRDFLIGPSLADTEAESIQNSRSIIFLITPEFKSSRNCLFELDRAKYEKVTKNLERIIVITKDITIADIPVEFSYIWNYAYLVEWPDNLGNVDDTWRKLRMLLNVPLLSYK